MTDLELRLYTSLKLIAKAYQTPAQIRRNSEKKYGLPYEEALTSLKPCPFCGGTNCTVSVRTVGKWKFVYCPDCLAEGPADDLEVVAVAEWNRRVLSATAQPVADDAAAQMPDSDVEQLTPNQRRALSNGLAALETMADLWAVEVRLTEMSERIASVPDETDRAKRIAAMIHLGFIEGAYRHFLDHKGANVAAAQSEERAAVAWAVTWPGDPGETWHSVFVNERDALQSASHHAGSEVTPLYIHPTPQAGAGRAEVRDGVTLTADDSDMVWLADDGETFFHSIDDAVDCAVDQEWPSVEPLELKLSLGKRIPTATVRVFNITENGHEWEFVDAAREGEKQ